MVGIGLEAVVGALVVGALDGYCVDGIDVS